MDQSWKRVCESWVRGATRAIPEITTRLLIVQESGYWAAPKRDCLIECENLQTGCVHPQGTYTPKRIREKSLIVWGPAWLYTWCAQ